MVVRKREIICEYQPYIDNPPYTGQDLYKQSCSNDEVTVNSWRDTWLKQIKENHESFGPFKEKGIGRLWASESLKPVIIVGSGPSLKLNAHELKDNPGIAVISCLHNFHFLEDLGVKVDYYVTLDAGPITISEVSEGGSRTAEEYWELTKDRKLLAFIGTHPDLLKKWRGEVLFFNCPLPDASLMNEIEKIEKFRTSVSTGGNVLGACAYIAKAILGCNPLVFVGADFSFSYLDKFHAWDSSYDASLGNYIRMTDVFGNSVKSWQSYANFKAWFDSRAMTVPGQWVNCTEGGTFGAYPGGNIRHVKQQALRAFLDEYKLHYHIKDQCENPETDDLKILF